MYQCIQCKQWVYGIHMCSGFVWSVPFYDPPHPKIAEELTKIRELLEKLVAGNV